MDSVVQGLIPKTAFDLQSPNERKQSEDALTYRRHLKMIEDERTAIRKRLDVLHSFEELLLDKDDLRQFVQTSAEKQAEALSKVEAAMGKIEERLRAEFPASVSPMIQLANAEEWHIKLGFEYPSPDNPEKMIRYGPGEKLPPNMTQKDCDTLYALGHIYRVERGKDGKCIFKPHPKVVQLTQGQMIELFKKPVTFVIGFLTRNTIRLDTLLRMKVVLAEMSKGGNQADDRIEKLVDAKIRKFEAAATGQPGQPT